MGLAKLVPTLMLLPSVQIDPAATGPRVPLLLVVRIGYRQGVPASTLTQLPAGAAIVTSGPRSEKPTASSTSGS